MVRKALRSAEMRGLVRRNVALQVPLRRVPRYPRPALSPDVARRILAALAGDRYEAAFALAFIGLREGEVLGLAHEDIDLEARTAAVRYDLVGSGPAGSMTSATERRACWSGRRPSADRPGAAASRVEQDDVEIYSHVSAAQQREAIEVLQRALVESHAESHAKSGSSGAESPRVEQMGGSERESGPAVGSRPVTEYARRTPA
jgi:hypothetical protein